MVSRSASVGRPSVFSGVESDMSDSDEGGLFMGIWKESAEAETKGDDTRINETEKMVNRIVFEPCGESVGQKKAGPCLVVYSINKTQPHIALRFNVTSCNVYDHVRSNTNPINRRL